MGLEVRVAGDLYRQAGADDSAGGTAASRGQSQASEPGASSPPPVPAAYRASGLSNGPGWSPATPPAGVLMDFLADSDASSLELLTATATLALAEPAGCPLDCAVTLTRPGQKPLLVGTSESAVSLMQADQEHGDGPVSQALAGEPGVILNSYTRHARWPTYWRRLQEAGYRSILSLPLPLGPGRAAAVTILTATDNVFTPGVTAAAEAFRNRAAASYLTAEELRTVRSSAHQLQSALRTRTPIDVACGVIMGQNRCSYDDAFQILAKASSHRNVKVRVVAETILQDAPGGTPSTHFGQ